MPLTPISVQFTPAGAIAPTYADILAWLQGQFRAIFGADAYIDADSQDGQWIAVQAQAIYDANMAAVAAYNQVKPSYAQGTGLSALVKLNGLKRKLASQSTADGNVVGRVGTVITNGVVSDEQGNLWDLPGQVVIPAAGFVLVTVTAREAGNFTAPAGTINTIATPQSGWQSFLSTTDAVAGAAVESDADLRKRQAASTGFPSNSPLAGVLAGVFNLPGVTRAAAYENTGNGADANGLAAHSISVIAEGGVAADIAATIGQRKTPGAATYGTTVVAYVDPVTGIAYNINFYALAYQVVTVEVTVKVRPGWASTVGDAIKQAIVDHIAGLEIGEDVDLSRVYLPAYLFGGPLAGTFEVTALTLNAAGADVVIPFNKAAQTLLANVTLTIAP